MALTLEKVEFIIFEEVRGKIRDYFQSMLSLKSLLRTFLEIFYGGP